MTGKSVIMQVARHQGEIMKALQERFGSEAIDTARMQFDVAPSGLLLGVSVDGERIYEAPDVKELDAASIDLAAYGTSAVWINELGDIRRIDPAAIFMRKPEKEGTEP